ncbi:phage antirepressor KilAC domain-containing protein [Xanthomonas citri]|uniref:phage antirepressor KilAC domain-containing protein n=2 Tax=Xanthomonas citri TaxID=346 RepID=UPI00138994A8|nr:phage regulatory protein/antirepressor Ant [Xanthomonas citri]
MRDLVTLRDGKAVTMTSREISELTGKEHDNVRRDIKNMGAELSLTFEEKTVASTGGRPSVVFVLSAREVKILVTGYSITLRAKVIDRLEELEARAVEFDPVAVLADPAAMRGLLLTYTEKVIELQHTVQEQAPKVAALDRLADAEGSFGLREASQVLEVPERKLTRYLDAEGWIYKMPGSRRWQGYAEKRKAGLVTHKTRKYEREDGVWCEADYVRITPKGIAKLAQQFAQPADLFTTKAPA